MDLRISSFHRWSFFLLLLISLPCLLRGQVEEDICWIYPVEEYGKERLDSLEELFGAKKHIPESYRLPALIALSAYPELKKVPILFKEDEIPTTMAARPILSTLWGDQKARRYHILIDTLAPASEGKLFSELSLEARIGIMAHELAHILDYERRSPAGLLFYSIRYAFEGGRKRLEERTDRIAVKRGFGWQVLAFKDHLRACAELEASYAAYKERVYLSYEELLRVLASDPLYELPGEERNETDPSPSSSQ